ncbi:MAG: DMT family transporter [Rubrobacteraceae bacterium]
MKSFLLDKRVLVALVITVVLWAAAFAGIRAALVSYGPGEVALFRLLVASVTLAGYALLTRMRMPEARDLPVIFLCGFFGFTVYHVGLTFGERTVEAGSASLLISTAPIFIALLASAFLGERLKVLGWAGMGLSFAGAAIISFGEGGGYRFDFNALPILLAALSESVYFVVQRPYLRKYGSLAFTTYAIWAGTVPALFFLPGLLSQVRDATPGATFSGAFLGIFPTAIAYVTYAYVSSRMTAAVSASFLYLIPALAFLVAWVWLGETPHPVSIVGGLLALAGVLVVNGYRR